MSDVLGRMEEIEFTHALALVLAQVKCRVYTPLGILGLNLEKQVEVVLRISKG